MTRRLACALLAVAALFLAACREDGKPLPLSEDDLGLLRQKADEKIASIAKQDAPAQFAGLVVFRSDAFLYNSGLLEQRDVPVLNVFGDAAIVLLKRPDILPLLKEPAIRKARYLCRQGALARFDPAFEMEMLRRFGKGLEDDNVAVRIRFREPPKEKDEGAVAAAGFRIDSREGFVLRVTGPLAALPRLLANDGIVEYAQ